MFKRKWSGLPADPVFPSSLEGLGYFINRDDEIRSIDNEDNYFKFFINRNPRFCDRQRFSFNQACQAEIHTRLEGLGMEKVFLPLGTTEEEHPLQPKTPIFISRDIGSKSRVIIIFGEMHQDLGVLAHRVIGGRGGIDEGSLVQTVRAIGQRSRDTDPSTPGIILANMGELLWWPEGRRTLNPQAFDWAPMHSAAHKGNAVVPSIHYVSGNESSEAHVKYIFEKVVPAFVNKAAGIDVIGIGSGADTVEDYLNNDATWELVGPRLNCMAIIAGTIHINGIECDGLREFLRERTRLYTSSEERVNVVLSGPDGNPNMGTSSEFGCYVFSAGNRGYIETLFIDVYPAVLAWMREVASTPVEERPYKNPKLHIVHADPPPENQYWTTDDAKCVSFDENIRKLEEERKNLSKEIKEKILDAEQTRLSKIQEIEDVIEMESKVGRLLGQFKKFGVEKASMMEDEIEVTNEKDTEKDTERDTERETEKGAEDTEKETKKEKTLDEREKDLNEREKVLY